MVEAQVEYTIDFGTLKVKHIYNRYHLPQPVSIPVSFDLLSCLFPSPSSKASTRKRPIMGRAEVNRISRPCSITMCRERSVMLSRYMKSVASSQAALKPCATQSSSRYCADQSAIPFTSDRPRLLLYLASRSRGCTLLSGPKLSQSWWPALEHYLTLPISPSNKNTRSSGPDLILLTAVLQGEIPLFDRITSK